jgi:hypothetical protein
LTFVYVKKEEVSIETTKTTEATNTTKPVSTPKTFKKVQVEVKNKNKATDEEEAIDIKDILGWD